jgi:hypothetical protein
MVGAAADPTGRLHYFICLERAAIKNTKLADNLMQYASAHPALQKGSVQKALLQYLIAACGKPD